MGDPIDGKDMIQGRPQPSRPPEAGARPANEKDEPTFPSVPPSIRAKGMRSQGLMTRVQSLAPHKLALISAGLGLLVLAPVIEFWVRPGEDGTLRRGFDQKLDAFGEAGAPYEEGVLGMAAGGLPGQDNRVITPGDFADPTSLIKTGRVEEPEVQVPAGPAVPAKKPATDWKDVLSGARQSSASAPAPKSFVARTVEKLKGFLSGFKSGDAARGSGASLQVARLEAPRSEGLTGTQRVASSLTRVERERDFRGPSAAATGASGASGATQRGGLFDGGRGGGSDSGAGLLRGKVTNESVSATDTRSGSSAGSGGGGLDGGGAPGRDPSSNSSKDNRAFEAKESLGELAKKLNMQKSIEHKWKKREWNDIGKKQKQLEIKGQLMNTALQGAFQLAGQALQAGGGGGGGQSGGGGGGSGGGGGGSGGGAGEGEGGGGSLSQKLEQARTRVGGVRDVGGETEVVVAKSKEEGDKTKKKGEEVNKEQDKKGKQEGEKKPEEKGQKPGGETK